MECRGAGTGFSRLDAELGIRLGDLPPAASMRAMTAAIFPGLRQDRIRHMAMRQARLRAAQTAAAGAPCSAKDPIWSECIRQLSGDPALRPSRSQQWKHHSKSKSKSVSGSRSRSRTAALKDVSRGASRSHSHSIGSGGGKRYRPLCTPGKPPPSPVVQSMPPAVPLWGKG